MTPKTYHRISRLSSIALLLTLIFSGHALAQFTYQWKTDTTYEGVDKATLVQPVQVMFLQQPIQIVPHSSSLRLMQEYSVLLGTEWSDGQTYRLLQTFDSIPQLRNYFSDKTPRVSSSLWQLTDQHIQNDIEIRIQDGQKIVTLSREAFTYADPLLAEIEGVRGRFFSKRLHHAVVRYVTDGGRDRRALKRILENRYGVSIDVPDYIELTRRTTKEDAGRFGEFKNEELITLVSMFEEYPQGMLTTPGLQYLVRRLDGTPHPINPNLLAAAWTSAGYIEFMESAFKGRSLDTIHRIILHEKAHFLWAHLFDDQLKQDWIELGGWYVNPDDKNGWSTTKQTEFVSAYAHKKNPNEDMAETISYYILNPDKLRSRSPAKYEFVRDRVMHGTRYISRIREDLTFQVYNLYPDVMYPGRIIRVDIQVAGEPEEDKVITIELEIHQEEGSFDNAQKTPLRIHNTKGTYFDIWLYPVSSDGRRVNASHVLRGHHTLSKHAAYGYWGPDQITLKDAQGNERHESQVDFGWKLYVNNPLADNEPPEYVKKSMQLSLSQSTVEGRLVQILTARWQLFEEVGMQERGVYATLNDANAETYSRRSTSWGEYNPQIGEASVELKIPDYFPGGTYAVNYIEMRDRALNMRGVYFTDPGTSLKNRSVIIDEAPAIINIQTTNPDDTPPVLDLNQITIQAEPTNIEEPNGETKVDISFRIKDDISGYSLADLYLRDPNGVMHNFRHYDPDIYKVYFTRDPAVYETYHQTIILPVGSIPGTWGIAEMKVFDKAYNLLRANFTEIIRFEVTDTPLATADFDGSGQVDIADFLLFVEVFGTQSGQENFDPKYDLDGDGIIGIPDFLIFVDSFGKTVTG